MTQKEKVELARGTLGTALMEIENRIQTLLGALISNDRQAGCAQNAAHDEIFRYYNEQSDELAGKDGEYDEESQVAVLHQVFSRVNGRVCSLVEAILDRDKATQATNTVNRFVWLDYERFKQRVIDWS